MSFMGKQKIIILLTVFIDVVGLGLVLPTLPLYVERYGASPFVATSFFAVFAVCQFFGAPLLGAWSDRIGRRPILVMSLLGTSIGWFVFALANSLPLLFLGRVIDGLTGGNISTAQSYLVDISKTDRERTENLGIIGTAFGLGFILGPVLGGVLSAFGTTVPFYVAGSLALLNTIAAYFFLPETHHQRTNQKISLNPFIPIINGFKNKKLNLYLLSWFLFSMAFTNLQNIFTLFVNRQFDFDAVHSGYLLALVGVIAAVNQGFLLKHFWLKKFPEPLLELIAVIALIFAYFFISFGQFAIFMISLVIFSFAQAILRVVANSQIAGNAEPHQKGAVIGIVQGLTSLAAIIIPPLSGYIFERDIAGPWYLGSGLMVIALILILAGRKRIQKSPLPMDTGVA